MLGAAGGTGAPASATPRTDSASGDDDDEVFEIFDYTIVSPLERLAADIEAAVRGWNLHTGHMPREEAHAILKTPQTSVYLTLHVGDRTPDPDGGLSDSLSRGLPDRRGPKFLRWLGLRAALTLTRDGPPDPQSAALLLSCLSLAADSAGVRLPLLVPSGPDCYMGRTITGAQMRVHSVNSNAASTSGIDSAMGAARWLGAQAGLSPAATAALSDAAVVRTVHECVRREGALDRLRLACRWDGLRAGVASPLQARQITLQLVLNERYRCPRTQPLRMLLAAWCDVSDDDSFESFTASEHYISSSPQDEADAVEAIAAVLRAAEFADRSAAAAAIDAATASTASAGESPAIGASAGAHTAQDDGWGDESADAAARAALEAVMGPASPTPSVATSARGDISRQCKGAPRGSLCEQLARTLAGQGSVRRMGATWLAFVDMVRAAWRDRRLLPGVQGAPDWSHSLLHQKLCMLNCCIRASAQRPPHPSPPPRPQGTADGHGDGGGDAAAEAAAARTESSKSQSDEEFYDAPDHLEVAVGRQRPLLGLMSLSSGLPLYEPVTLEPPPFTEDMIASQSAALASLGTGAEAAQERARLQSAALRADMQAFKAANPGSCLEDFIRWHSPRDWTPDGGLSARMAQPGNMWQQLWAEAVPLPAAQQPLLWNARLEAASVLRWLIRLPVSDALAYLWAIALSAAVQDLSESAPVPTAETAAAALLHKVRSVAAQRDGLPLPVRCSRSTLSPRSTPSSLDAARSPGGRPRSTHGDDAGDGQRDERPEAAGLAAGAGAGAVTREEEEDSAADAASDGCAERDSSASGSRGSGWDDSSGGGDAESGGEGDELRAEGVHVSVAPRDGDSRTVRSPTYEPPPLLDASDRRAAAEAAELLVQLAQHAERVGALAAELLQRLPSCARLIDEALRGGDAEVFSAERLPLLALCGLNPVGTGPAAAAAAAAAVSAGVPVGPSMQSGAAAGGPGAVVYSSRFAVPSAAPDAEAQVWESQVVQREVVVRWESDVRPAAPCAARLYVYSDGNSLTAASTLISDVS